MILIKCFVIGSRLADAAQRKAQFRASSGDDRPRFGEIGEFPITNPRRIKFMCIRAARSEEGYCAISAASRSMKAMHASTCEISRNSSGLCA